MLDQTGLWLCCRTDDEEMTCDGRVEVELSYTIDGAHLQLDTGPHPQSATGLTSLELSHTWHLNYAIYRLALRLSALRGNDEVDR